MTDVTDPNKRDTGGCEPREAFLRRFVPDLDERDLPLNELLADAFHEARSARFRDDGSPPYFCDHCHHGEAEWLHDGYTACQECKDLLLQRGPLALAHFALETRRLPPHALTAVLIEHWRGHGGEGEEGSSSRSLTLDQTQERCQPDAAPN